MERILGVGGVFFKARDPKGLADWYREHLGVPVEADQTHGRIFSGSAGETTVWSTFEEFKKVLGKELLGEDATPQAVADLLELHRVCFFERSWCQPSPLVSPEVVRARKEAGRLDEAKAAEYRSAIERVRGIEERSRSAASAGPRELHRAAEWVLAQWGDDEAAGLLNGSR